MVRTKKDAIPNNVYYYHSKALIEGYWECRADLFAFQASILCRMWLTLDDAAAAASSSSRSLLVTDLDRTRPPPLSVSPEEKLEQRFFSLRHRRASDEVLPLLRSGVGAIASLLKERGWETDECAIVFLREICLGSSQLLKEIS